MVSARRAGFAYGESRFQSVCCLLFCITIGSSGDQQYLNSVAFQQALTIYNSELRTKDLERAEKDLADDEEEANRFLSPIAAIFTRNGRAGNSPPVMNVGLQKGSATRCAHIPCGRYREVDEYLADGTVDIGVGAG